MNQNLALITLLLTLGFSITSFGSNKMQNLNCARDEFGDAEGYQVTITHYASYSKALLYVVDPGGQHTLGKYKVAYYPADPKKPGHSAEYRGLNFKLRLRSNSRPRPDGLISASLRAVSQIDGFTIEEKLLCRTDNLNNNPW